MRRLYSDSRYSSSGRCLVRSHLECALRWAAAQVLTEIPAFGGRPTFVHSCLGPASRSCAGILQPRFWWACLKSKPTDICEPTPTPSCWLQLGLLKVEARSAFGALGSFGGGRIRPSAAPGLDPAAQRCAFRMRRTSARTNLLKRRSGPSSACASMSRPAVSRRFTEAPCLTRLRNILLRSRKWLSCIRQSHIRAV